MMFNSGEEMWRRAHFKLRHGNNLFLDCESERAQVVQRDDAQRHNLALGWLAWPILGG
jgi:hypothetical protein